MATVFTDREATYPNRYKVTTDSGDTYYITLERADEATVEGTPLNAKTFNGLITEIDEKLSEKAATISGGASTIASSNLTASRALVSNSSGKVVVSAVTSTELGYLDGVTSNVQTQLNAKAANTAAGLKAQLANGNTILSSYQYGTSLPSTATKGRIFFKKVST